MRLRPSRAASRGKVLFSVMIIAVLASMVVGALLLLAQQQHYITARSATWCSEIPLAEAGIEEAMAHLNSSKIPRLATNGWAYNGNAGFSKSRTLPEGYFYATIFTNKPERIVSIGYGRIPRQTNYTSRTILAMIKRLPPAYGIIGRQGVALSGTSVIDSYNSADPEASTGGLYDISKRRDEAGVATHSSARPAITTGSAKIYGWAATGPAGTVEGNVGDGVFLSTSSGIQEGHVADDFNMAMGPASLPSPWGGFARTPLPGIVGGVSYSYVLVNGDYEMSDLKVSGGKGVYVTGNVRVWIRGDFRLSGGAEILMGPSATLEIYLSGNADVSGRGIINPSGNTTICSFYGLPSCTSIKLTGSADLYLKLYAPNADVEVGGTFDFHGSMVGKTVECNGLAGIHYDEALGGRLGPSYKIISWEEL